MIMEFLSQMMANAEERMAGEYQAWWMYIRGLAGALYQAYEGSRPVVWTSLYAFPMELLAAFDVISFDLEMASNFLPVSDPKISEATLVAAETKGYSRDICSVHRMGLGGHFQGILPRADLILTSSFYCNGKHKMTEILSQYLQKPVTLLDVPNEDSPEAVSYVVRQLHDIVKKLEELTGSSLDPGRLREVVRYSNRARSIWGEVLELQKNRPAPWNGFRLSNVSILGNIFAGTSFQAEFYEQLVTDLKKKISKRNLPGESHRILWLTWPEGQPTLIPGFFLENGMTVPVSETGSLYWDPLDEKEPFEGMARKLLQNPFVGPAEQRITNITKLLDDFQIGGAVHFTQWGCRHSNGSIRLIGDTLAERGLPLLVLEGDLSDPRNYFPEKTRMKLEGFLEVLEKR